MSISMKDATEKELSSTVISSSVFQESMDQKHHYDTTLGKHSIAVKDGALKICGFLEKIGIKTDHKSVIAASLCHDLGMVGRYQKYKNDLQCCRKHPDDSVEEARKLIPDMDKKTEDAIRSHMWPLSRHIPKSKTGWILLAADKEVSLKGTIKHIFSKRKIPSRQS